MRSMSCRLPAGLTAIFCATLMTISTGAHLQAQSAGGNAAAMANTTYTYPGYELWNPASWPGSQSKAAPIASWLMAHEQGTHPEYVVKDKYKGVKDWVGHPDYNWKTESVTDAEVMAPLTRMGLRVDVREGGGLAIFVAPEKVLADKTRKAPMLLVSHMVDKMDVFWAMNTLVHFRKYSELCAQRGDFILVIVVMEKPGGGRQTALNNTAIETASDVYRGDYKRLLLDMSTFEEAGVKPSSLPGLDWSDDQGNKRNPDAEMEKLGPIPVLNVAGMWNSKPSFGMGMSFPRKDIQYDPQLVMHGLLGEHLMQGSGFLHSHGKDSSADVKDAFEKMGLVFSEHHTQSERWLLFSPRVAVEKAEKLPLVLVLLEVYDFNEYAASSAYAQYQDYFKLAAAGQLNLMFFGLESPDTMELAATIIKEAEQTAPIDPSRIYVTGHSHNGHLSREFAYRHPELVAAVAPLGNSSGLAAPAYSHEAVVADDARIEAWSKIDMPNITIGADSEVFSPHARPSSILNDYDLYIESWQRRQKAARLPQLSREQIMAAEKSADTVTRMFGVPNDSSWMETIDGVKHYFMDVKNVDGRKHLRIVGVDNMIHTPEPTMPMVAWSFLRRFARDQKTGQVIDLE